MTDTDLQAGIQVRAGGLTPEGYQALVTAVGWEPRSTADARNLIINARHCVSAWANGELVGMGRVTGVGVSYAHLTDIAVVPERHGQGIGTSILEHLLRLVDRSMSPAATVTLNAVPGAEAFYRRFGFVASETPGLMTRSRAGEA